jgi:hypothetical protein
LLPLQCMKHYHHEWSAQKNSATRSDGAVERKPDQ